MVLILNTDFDLSISHRNEIHSTDIKTVKEQQKFLKGNSWQKLIQTGNSISMKCSLQCKISSFHLHTHCKLASAYSNLSEVNLVYSGFSFLTAICDCRLKSWALW